MIKLNYLFAVVALFFLVGCSNKEVRPSIYEWGSYSKTSAAYVMYKEREDIRSAHKNVLEKIITKSEAESKKVPPSIYAEYAELLYDSNEKVLAKKYFLLEKDTYPESSVFINRILNKLYGGDK